MKNRAVLLCLVAAGGWSFPAAAQEQAARADSVLLRVRELERRLDSLERVVAELRAASQPTAEPADELAALRAAARAAAGPARARADTAAPQASRTRNLQILNPEISVTGDVVGTFVSPGGGDKVFSGTPREFEFSFQSALDPYTRTKIFITREEDFEIAGFPEEEEEEGGGFEIEEGYLYWVGLPGGFGAKLGKFRQEVGLYNRWHTHALFEVERPLASTALLGEDGLIQTGLGVTLPTFSVGPTTQTATFEVTRGNNEALFDGGTDISYLGRVQSFWDLGTSYLQVGATGVVGDNNDADLESRLLGLDVSFRWAPPRQARYRELQLKGEWYFAERTELGEVFTAQAGYLQANLRVTRRWILGTRADYVDGFDATPDIVQIAPSLTWWQSEWVRLRLQYNYVKPDGGANNHTLLLQAVWAIGPDKHEIY